ncbi:MAG: type II secretion system protein E [Gammaproteobacteria bacterium HGW-Gammaproteobacteria-1]|jgi:general secretion pathway protein E|nr:MAG: type II secretion system protein E [Gammaproteobacteria bacterium HGW-Gammaproteobacteria-1]
MAKSVLHDQPLQLGRVLDQLVADGLLDAERGNTLKAVAPAMARQQHPLITIAQHKWPDARAPQRVLDLPLLTEWLAGKSGLDSARIDPLKVDVPAITAVMSYAYARRFNILALEVRPDEVVVATAEPAVREWERELTRILGKRIVRVLVDPEQISRYLIEFYTLSHSVRAASDDNRQGERSGVQNLEQLMELGRAGKLEADDQHIVSIVDWLLQYAYAQRASDIHIEPRREQTNIRFRIDGVMHMVYQIPVSVATAVTSRIKILGRMDVSEKRRPQDGRLKTRSAQGNEVELRLSTMPTAFGEKLVMRIFDPDVLVKDYQALGFSSSETQLWTRLINEPTGIILVTGPTGSGKTTTLYTTLKELATPEVNICTIEDPVELVEPSFNQMQVQHNIGLDFASGVRTLLRQDPDIIMVGEIRDRETAEMAVQAALTGHLVFSTLHTNDASSAITRLLEIGVPPYLIKATVLGVLGQRLVRTLCPHCKETAPLDDDLWQSLVAPWKVNRPAGVSRPVGCLECRQTGYRGRVGVYEMLEMTPALKALVTADCDIARLRRQAISDGMRPLRLNGAQKVANGVTTIEEVLKVAPPETLET